MVVEVEHGLLSYIHAISMLLQDVLDALFTDFSCQDSCITVRILCMSAVYDVFFKAKSALKRLLDVGFHSCVISCVSF